MLRVYSVRTVLLPSARAHVRISCLRWASTSPAGWSGFQGPYYNRDYVLSVYILTRHFRFRYLFKSLIQPPPSTDSPL
ncbi:hypothetical protein BKA83DRAFT_4257591 [Pisolithus microcarpus]|nr:hypothetical protein BKA83DRAFT_4257591 [Pisolithus microcarpus]